VYFVYFVVKPMKKAAPFLLIAALLLGIGIRLYFLQKQANPDSQTAGAPPPEQLITEDILLFNELIASALITPLADGRLKLAPPDQILAEKAERAENPKLLPPDPEKLKNRERLLKALYHEPAGNIIRSQVNLWNSTRHLTAIRDNRPKPKHDTANTWRACDSRDPQWDFPNIGELVPESFGFVNNEKLRPNFSDWLAAYTPSETVIFHTVLTLEAPCELLIQVIGKPETVYPKASRIEFCCREKQNCSSETADAAILHFSLSPGRHEFSISVSPANNTDRAVPGLNIRMGSREEFQWVNLPRKSSATYKYFKLMTSDNIPLTDDQGNPTDECENMGLVSLTGYGTHTPYSLYSLLARSMLPPDVENIVLTIDSKIQSVAQEVLVQKIAEFWPGDKYAGERRGAVVILDPDTGAILAAAGCPVPPAGIHPWDFASFAKVYPIKNPLLVRGWQGLDQHNAPGSTFKPVVALAAMAASGHQPDLMAFLEGFPKSKFEDGTALSLNCAYYDPFDGKCYGPRETPPVHRIPNFGNPPGTLGQVFARNKDKGKHSVFGLREAVRDSVNVWFARLTVMMDGENARRYDEMMESRQSADFPEFQLMKTARELGFGDLFSLDLALNTPPNVRLYRLKPVEGSREGDVLYGNSGRSDLREGIRGSLLWILAQNAIGQGMNTSPLQMAKVAAAIAGGKIVSPYLFRQWGETETQAPEPKAIEGGAMMELLRKGMKAVTETGTAKGKFKNLAGSVYGKTGTADVQGKAVNTTWFIGWSEPEAERGKKMAFACMVTHAHGGKRTGGSVCAPIINEILEKLKIEN
jgi:cell division protein FtsI/penicillin-binding protein 2